MCIIGLCVGASPRRWQGPPGPRVVKRLNDKCEELIIHHKLGKRIASLTSVAMCPLLPWVTKECEWLDRMKAARAAEAGKRCLLVASCLWKEHCSAQSRASTEKS